MNEFLWQAFITLIVIINPASILPVFIGLTAGDSLEVKRRIALKSILVAALILLSFAFVGDRLLDLMGISQPAFRIAGGFLLLLAAINMVMAQPNERRGTSAQGDVSIFPLSIPLTAGPGALTSIVFLMRQAETFGSNAQIGVLLVLGSVLMITYIALLLGDHLTKILGITGVNVLTRVSGILLAAMAIQNIINGIKIVVQSMMLG